MEPISPCLSETIRLSGKTESGKFGVSAEAFQNLMLSSEGSRNVGRNGRLVDC